MAIDAVAAHRGADLSPLAEVLDGYADLGQARWIAWRRRSNSDHLPESLAGVLEGVFAFADPVVGSGETIRNWDPQAGHWR